jgi:hypothetical protein
MVPKTLHDKITALLYSELENRVPFGAHQKFLTDLLISYFTDETLDLAHYAPPKVMLLPGYALVRGQPHALASLKSLLTSEKEPS